MKQKPGLCPFCGAKYGDDHEDGCFIPMSAAVRMSSIIGEPSPYSIEQLVEAWNTRYEPTCQIEKVTDGLTPDWWHCLACDGYIPAPDEISFCPYCGARVEKVD